MDSEGSAAALLFDNDGTLVDSLPFLYALYQEALQELGGLSMPWKFFLRLTMENRRAVDILVAAAGEQGRLLRRDSVEKVLGKVSLRALSRPLAIRPIEATVSIARRAKARGQPIALVTAGPKWWAEGMLAAAGLEDLFVGSVIVTSDTVGLRRQKPHPEPYLMAAEKLGVAPHACIGYEDSDSGLEGLRKAGMHAVDVRLLAGYPVSGLDGPAVAKL